MRPCVNCPPGINGLAHMTCLAQLAESQHKNLFVWNEGKSTSWNMCQGCGDHYGGLVGLALAWTAWRAVQDLPPNHGAIVIVMSALGKRLVFNQHFQDGIRILRQCNRMVERYSPNDDFLKFQAYSGFTIALLSVPSASHEDLREAEARLVDTLLPYTPPAGAPRGLDGMEGVLDTIRGRLARLDP